MGQIFCLLYRGSFYMEAISQATPFKNECMTCKRLETATQYIPSTNTNSTLSICFSLVPRPHSLFNVTRSKGEGLGCDVMHVMLGIEAKVEAI